MPSELKFTIYPIKIITKEEYIKLWYSWMARKQLGNLKDNETKLPSIGMLKSQYDYLMEKYGYSNWYEWAIGNYGTKLPAYNVGEWDIYSNLATIEYKNNMGAMQVSLLLNHLNYIQI